jgi:hypothetical protein
MPELPEAYPTPLDFTRYNERARREIYSRLVEIQFGLKFPAYPYWTPPLYTPDDAGLMVFYVFGRWFGAWTNLEEPTYLPESRRVELVRIQPAPGSPDGIVLFEV